MFGRGKFNTGVVIEPMPEFAFDPADKAKLSEFRNKIWYVKPFGRGCKKSWGLTSHIPYRRPTVERMNEYAPQHSRVFKEVGGAVSDVICQKRSTDNVDPR